MVDLVAAAAGVLKGLVSLTVSRTRVQCVWYKSSPEALNTYETTQAPPATVFLQDRQLQIPTE